MCKILQISYFPNLFNISRKEKIDLKAIEGEFKKKKTTLHVFMQIFYWEIKFGSIKNIKLLFLIVRYFFILYKLMYFKYI